MQGCAVRIQPHAGLAHPAVRTCVAARCEAFVRRVLPLLFLLYAPLALADEHLVAEENQFTRANLPNGQGSLAPYYDRVLTLLGAAFTPQVRARVIAMPSDAPEYAVGIREREGAFSIFHIGPKTN